MRTNGLAPDGTITINNPITFNIIYCACVQRHQASSDYTASITPGLSSCTATNNGSSRQPWAELYILLIGN